MSKVLVYHRHRGRTYPKPEMVHLTLREARRQVGDPRRDSSQVQPCCGVNPEVAFVVDDPAAASCQGCHNVLLAWMRRRVRRWQARLTPPGERATTA